MPGWKNVERTGEVTSTSTASSLALTSGPDGSISALSLRETIGPPPVCCQSQIGGRPPRLAPRSILWGHNTPVARPEHPGGPVGIVPSLQPRWHSRSCKRRKGWLPLTREHGTSNRRLQRVREMDAESGIRLGTSARGKAEKQAVYECLDDQRQLTTLRFTMVRRRTMHGVIHAT